MKTCEEYKKLIEKYVEATISDGQLNELKTHTQTCESCREEFGRCVLLHDVVRQAFSSPTAADRAGALLADRLSAGPNLRLSHVRFGAAFFTGSRFGIAAGVLLAVGLLIGFGVGRASKSTGAPLTVQVPISVSKIEGTVLVKHEGSDVWQALKAGSDVYLGDTFHSTAASACVLKLEDKSTLALNQNSMLVLKLYNDEAQFFLEHGECTASLESPHGPFFIGTPHGRVEALGTEFTVKVTDK